MLDVILEKPTQSENILLDMRNNTPLFLSSMKKKKNHSFSGAKAKATEMLAQVSPLLKELSAKCQNTSTLTMAFLVKMYLILCYSRGLIAHCIFACASVLSVYFHEEFETVLRFVMAMVC